MEHQYKVGEWYKTRCGYDAQVFDVNYNSSIGKSIVGKIKIGTAEEVCAWRSDGAFFSHGAPYDYDLMPPVERKELWANVYKNWLSCPEKTKDEAKKSALSECIGMIHIVIEGDDFTVEKVMG